MPSIGPNALEIASTVGWSMTMASTLPIFCPPTSNSLTLTSPIEPNSEKAGRFMPLNRPASLPILLFRRLIGAPVSKISLYGPLPLTFTLTVMWPVLRTSNGTTPLAGFFSVGVSARAGAATKTTSRAVRNRCFVRVMLQPLPNRDGDLHFLLVVAAPDQDDDLLAGGHVVRKALQTV